MRAYLHEQAVQFENKNNIIKQVENLEEQEGELSQPNSPDAAKTQGSNIKNEMFQINELENEDENKDGPISPQNQHQRGQSTFTENIKGSKVNVDIALRQSPETMVVQSQASFGGIRSNDGAAPGHQRHASEGMGAGLLSPEESNRDNSVGRAQLSEERRIYHPKDSIPGNNQGEEGSMIDSQDGGIHVPFRGDSIPRDDHMSSSQYSNTAHVVGAKPNFNRGSDQQVTSPKEDNRAGSSFKKNNFELAEASDYVTAPLAGHKTAKNVTNTNFKHSMNNVGMQSLGMGLSNSDRDQLPDPDSRRADSEKKRPLPNAPSN